MAKAKGEAVPDTYGVGPAAKKLNIGATNSTVSILDSEGVVRADGKVTFDPKKDSVELIEADGLDKDGE